MAYSKSSQRFFEVLAPFSAYIKTLRVYGALGPKSPQFYPLPRLDLGSLQKLSFTDAERRHGILVDELLDALYESGDGSVSFQFHLDADDLRTVLRHPALRRSLEVVITRDGLSKKIHDLDVN
jgi:hypothetical protein